MAAAERCGEWRGGAELRCCRCLLLLRGGESERESEVGSTARSAYEGERVEGEAGRLRRAASFADAWRPRGERALTRSGACAADRRGTWEQGRGAKAGQAGLCGWAESEAAAH